MHLHKERIPRQALPGRAQCEEVNVSLSGRDIFAIDLALRVLLATSAPSDEFFEDVRTASGKVRTIQARIGPASRSQDATGPGAG